MDLATLIGLLGAFGIVLMAMLLGGGLLVFINIPSLLIVFFGSFMVVMMKFGIGQFFGAFKVAIKAFIFKLETPQQLIEKAIELASAARKDGLLALESMEINNKFFKTGVQYLVDGLDAPTIKATLKKRHEPNTRAARLVSKNL